MHISNILVDYNMELSKDKLKVYVYSPDIPGNSADFTLFNCLSINLVRGHTNTSIYTPQTGQ